MRSSGSTESLVGRTVAGKFAIEALLGTGAMGAVYKARHLGLDKVVAIKVLHDEHADDPAFAARFQREAKAASRLNHQNSMQVIDFGQEPDGLLYIAMEYLDGKNLHRVLKEEFPLAPARVCDIAMQTLAALAVAHDSGIVHRDLKPENIMILRGTNDDGQPTDVVKVCDFGIAKISESRSYRGDGLKDSAGPVTTKGFLVGTPEYMSPEQGRGEKLDARSDLYSVGVILYQMLAGVVPFEAENAIGVVLKHITDAPQPPTEFNPACDARLSAICLRAMQKRPDDRYASAREMRADLRATRGLSADVPSGATLPRPSDGSIAVADSAGHAPTVAVEAPKPTLQGTASSIPGLPSRRRLVAIASVLSLFAAGILGVGVFRTLRDDARRATPAATRGGGAALDITPDGVPPGGAADDPASEAPSPDGRHAHGVQRATLLHPIHAASASASASASPTTSATTDPQASGAPLASTAPPASAAAPESVPDPTFDPDKAYVVVGIVSGTGVRDSAVKAALRQANLGGCYHTALRARGARAAGMATLSLSVDEHGAVRGAVLTGADFLPGVRGCVQSAAYGIHLAGGSVDSGGGSADVYLQFVSP